MIGPVGTWSGVSAGEVVGEVTEVGEVVGEIAEVVGEIAEVPDTGVVTSRTYRLSSGASYSSCRGWALCRRQLQCRLRPREHTKPYSQGT